ncbi:G patch domain-containing protein 8 [Narcine bancroftii]|uniref:G patch domain-containing protein 8 n=1 Tax=Narcine bancroftii TaxID=1343680 RepID=UPI0038321DCC
MDSNLLMDNPHFPLRSYKRQGSFLTKRLKELKQREFARNVASRSRKDEKKQEKALKRLHQLAELQKQSECAPGSGPMFKPATVAIGNHVKAAASGSIAKVRSNGRKSNTQALSIKEEVLKRTRGNSLQCSPCGNQYVHGDPTSQMQGQFSLFTKKNSPCIPIQKGSVSFSFSKKAPLKLESSASVFNDTVEEKQCSQEAQSHKVKTIAEAEITELGAGISGTRDTEHNEQSKQPRTVSDIGSNPFARVKKLKALMLKENRDEAEKEYYCYSPAQCKTKTNFPFLFLRKSPEKPDMGKVVAPNVNVHDSQPDGSVVKCPIILEIGNEKPEFADGKKMAATQLDFPAHLLTTTPADEETLDPDGCKMKGDEPLGSIEKQTESKSPAKGKLSRVEPPNRSHLLNEPFLPVLSRDESIRLQWPSELLFFTQTEPSLSYSCNPLYFDFKLSRYKNRESGTTDQKNIKNCQHNVAITIEGDNGSGTTTEENGSREKEKDANVGKSGASRESRTIKNRNRSSKRLKQKSCTGYVRKRKKKHNQRMEDEYTWNTTEQGSQGTEGSSKEGRNSKLIPKRSFDSMHSSGGEEQLSSSFVNKKSVSPLDLTNKKQKMSSCSPLSISQGVCEDRKGHKSRRDSLNSSTGDSDSTEEHHSTCRKSFSHCSYGDNPRSERNACRKSRSYSSSQGSSFRSSSVTSSDHSRTSRRSRNHSDYSTRSRSRYCSKRHRRSHYKCHSRHRKKKHNYSSSSSLSSNDDYCPRKRSSSHHRNQGSAQTRTRMTRLHSWSRKSGSREQHSRRRSRYRSRSRHSRTRQECSRGSSLRRSCSRNTENCRQEISGEKLSRHRSSSKGRVYHIKSSLCSSDGHEVKIGSGKHHGTIKNEDIMQNYNPISPGLFQRNMSARCSILPLKKLIQDKKESCVAKHILENGQCQENNENIITTESASSAVGLKLKDSPQGYFDPGLSPSMDHVTLWSLIGKLTATQKIGAKTDGISKGDEPVHLEWNEKGTQSTGPCEESLQFKELHEIKIDIGQNSMCRAIENAEEEKIGLTIYQVQAGEEKVTPVPEEMSNVVSSTADVFTDGSSTVKEKNSQMTFYNSSDTNSVPMGEIMFDYCSTNSQSVDEVDPQFKEGSKSISSPLASQPLIFLPEEMEKYSKLQLQAQQHIEQQQWAKQVKTFPPSGAAAVTFTPVPAFQPVSLQQPSTSAASSVTTVHHTLLQHHAAASLTASIHPNAHHQAMAQLHHISQPHLVPFSFSPIAQAIIPTHPAAFLAGHPLHFFPAAAIHPAHLAFHPLPHTTLCPTLFAPHPAAAAASAIHLHPLLHPLFPGHNLQHRSGPST